MELSSLRSISTSAASSGWKAEGGGDARPNIPDDLWDASLFASIMLSGKVKLVGPGLPCGEPPSNFAKPESETEEIRRCALIRPPLEPVSGANDARFDE